MNRFEATRRFEASLSAVAPEQRRPLVAAFNAAIASTPDEDAAMYIIRLTDKRETLNTLAGASILGAVGVFGASMLYSYTSAAPVVPVAFLAACGLIGYGTGKALTAFDMTALMSTLRDEVSDWLDDEPEPEPTEHGRRIFETQGDRTLVSKYPFTYDELDTLSRLDLRTAITRPVLEGIGFQGMTTYTIIPGVTNYKILYGELERMGWASRVKNDLYMSRAGIAAARAHAEDLR